MKAFFPMRRSEAATLIFLIAFAAFAFIPAWRTAELWGMAVFGWLIAGLMLISPAITLGAFMTRRGGRHPDEDPTSGAGAAPGERPA